MKGTFQLTIIIIFIIAAILGILVFSGAIPLGKNKSSAVGTVVLWGTIKSSVMLSLLEDFNNANETFTVNYVEKSAENFDQNLLEALASGAGPDMFFLPENLAFHYANKIVPIPYQSFPLATFKNTFAGAGEVFLTSNGILAFPILVDPLVMYYNRSALDSNGIVYPSSTWEELSSMAPILTKKDNANKIITSGVALGHFSNITHAKDILSALFMQAGNPIITQKDGVFHSYLGSLTGKYNLAQVLQFYTDFADPIKPAYSWNKSFPNSTDAFSAENLAIYFGFASELQTLVNRNPNHNFFVAPLPQIKGEQAKVTAARVTGIAISSASKNFLTAFTATSLLASGDFASKFSLAVGVPPARRDLLQAIPEDAYSPTFYNSALYARSWLDPSPPATDDIFRRMVDGVLSNTMTPRDAVSDAGSKMELLLFK